MISVDGGGDIRYGGSEPTIPSLPAEPPKPKPRKGELIFTVNACIL